jgi:hypothetical protein
LVTVALQCPRFPSGLVTDLVTEIRLTLEFGKCRLAFMQASVWPHGLRGVKLLGPAMWLTRPKIVPLSLEHRLQSPSGYYGVYIIWAICHICNHAALRSGNVPLSFAVEEVRTPRTRWGQPWKGPLPRPVKVLGDQTSVPRQDLIRLGHARPLLQRFAAQSHPHFRPAKIFVGRSAAIARAATLVECGSPPPGTRSATAAVDLPGQLRTPVDAPTRCSSCRLSIIAGSA